MISCNIFMNLELLRFDRKKCRRRISIYTVQNKADRSIARINEPAAVFSRSTRARELDFSLFQKLNAFLSSLSNVYTIERIFAIRRYFIFGF